MTQQQLEKITESISTLPVKDIRKIITELEMGLLLKSVKTARKGQ